MAGFSGFAWVKTARRFGTLVDPRSNEPIPVVCRRSTRGHTRPNSFVSDCAPGGALQPLPGGHSRPCGLGMSFGTFGRAGT